MKTLAQNMISSTSISLRALCFPVVFHNLCPRPFSPCFAVPQGAFSCVQVLVLSLRTFPTVLLSVEVTVLKQCLAYRTQKPLNIIGRSLYSYKGAQDAKVQAHNYLFTHIFSHLASLFVQRFLHYPMQTRPTRPTSKTPKLFDWRTKWCAFKTTDNLHNFASVRTTI